MLGNGGFAVSVGGLLTELIVIGFGVPLASPPLGRTGNDVEEIIELAPASIAPAVPLTVALPTINGSLFAPPLC